MLKKRLGISTHDATPKSAAIARHFAGHPILGFVQSLAIYHPMRGEVDMLPLAQTMQAYRKTIALPRIQAPQTPLTFHIWQPGDGTERHIFGHEEPLAASPAITPEIILTPLLAFDGQGHRLGYGGGYYDATMQALRTTEHTPLFIGAGYSFQEVPTIPTEAHDTRLDGIITELGVSLFR